MLVMEATVFFRAVSRQLYGDPSHHLFIRQAGVQYLSNNPERFIESNTENSWDECINIMSMQGTWCTECTVCTSSCRLSKCSNSYYRIS